jgi:hypothetical protein
MNLLVDDLAVCKGCSFFDKRRGKCRQVSDADGRSLPCESLRTLTTDGPSVVCSNMLLSDPAPAAKGHGYRLTTGDIVFLSEWGA